MRNRDLHRNLAYTWNYKCHCTIHQGPWLIKNYKIILLKTILNQDELERNPVDDGVIKDQRSLKTRVWKISILSQVQPTTGRFTVG